MSNRVFRFYSTAPEIVFHHARLLAPENIVRLNGRGIGGAKYWQMIIVMEDGAGAERFSSWIDGNCQERSFRPGPKRSNVYKGPLHSPSPLAGFLFKFSGVVTKISSVIKLS
jgi:hypothetical protein